MNLLATLQSRHGDKTDIGYDFRSHFEPLANRGDIDACIVSTEEGFSPLGASLDFFARDLGIPGDEIKRLAHWNLSENPRTTLVALSSRRSGGRLRGIVLAPGETARCYREMTDSFPRLPYRAFYYNVTYEALVVLCNGWSAKNVAISHLSGSGRFHEDIATCNAEALAHFCDGIADAAPQSFVFCGCCISLDHLKGIARLNVEGQTSSHRQIKTLTEHVGQVDLVHLSWNPHATAAAIICNRTL
jgi:hypothetical protein